MTKNFVKTGVIGHPINHSKSPIIHNHWISKYGLNGEYKAINILPENLLRDISELVSAGYTGFNVTIPHKQAIFDLCVVVDDVAKIIGAINTIKIVNGKLHGTNTDAFGFIENLKSLQQKNIQKDKPVLVLGAGGAARAVVYGLLQEGFEEIVVTNRSPDKAIEISHMDKSRILSVSWENCETPLKEAGLLINTTSLGMTGKDDLNIDLSALKKDSIVCDIVYAPLMTPLLMAAKDKGCPIVTGIGMLLHQARPAFEKWFGIMPDIDDDLLQKVIL